MHPPKTENKIDLYYSLIKVKLELNLGYATADDLEEAIFDLKWLFSKSIARLEREKAKLTSPEPVSSGAEEQVRNVVPLLQDRLHREDGPAVEHPDGTNEWWLFGSQVSEDQFHHWRALHGLPALTSKEDL